MKAKLLLLALGISAAAGLTLNASILGASGTGASGTMARPTTTKLNRDATLQNEFGIRYVVRDYESVGAKPTKVEVIDLGPNWTPIKTDLAPFSGHVDVNGQTYQLVRDMNTGNLATMLPTSAFSGSGDSLTVVAFDRNGTQLGCFSFGFFF